MTAVCGPSGSGKSSLAFETLFAEGQRLFTSTLSNYARQYIQNMPKPLVSSIENIPPALALEQKNSVRSSRPVTATLIDLSDYLQLIFAHGGEVFCPRHKKPLRDYNPKTAAQEILKHLAGKKGMVGFPLKQPKKKADQNVLKALLLKQGFRRLGFLKKNQSLPDLIDLSSFKTFPKKDSWLILDRLVFKDESRLRDSLQLAFQLSALYGLHFYPQAQVFSEGNKPLYLGAKPSCLICGYRFPFPKSPALFSFNSSLGACAKCKGFGTHFILDEKKVAPDPTKSLAEGAVAPFTTPSTTHEARTLKQFCQTQKIDWRKPWGKLSLKQKKKIWEGGKGFIGVEGFFDYLETKKYKIHVRVFLARYKSPRPCEECQGLRFRKELSHVRFKGKSLPEIFKMDLESLSGFFKKLSLTSIEKSAIGDVVEKTKALLKASQSIGLGYLELNREVRTLSSGEFQRLNLIQQLGLNLSQVLYVLDEPTVGLHPQDTKKLIGLLKNLQNLGNTLVVVEHDQDMIDQADFIVEMGPKAGLAGGEVCFSGSKAKFLKQVSLTSSYLRCSKKKLKNLFSKRPVDQKKLKFCLEISGCRSHNLKNVSLKLPLNRLVTVTGVSGAGKSSLVVHTLYPALKKTFLQSRKPLAGGVYTELKGLKFLKQVVLLSAKTADTHQRSLTATYLKFYDSIRQLMAVYAEGPGSIRPGWFSLNVEGGRCPACKGLGFQEIDMVFMDPLKLTCEECRGLRFTEETLQWKWRGRNIHQILSMQVNEAMSFFVSHPNIFRPLSLLKKVGLDYLSLGQNLSSLSGGENQRLKLARELAFNESQNTLYIMDEPTLGLHFIEVELLLSVLNTLVQKGNSVLLIEHNLEVIRHSDYLIDMGPGAGRFGGAIQAEGSPEELAFCPKSLTGSFLKDFF